MKTITKEEAEIRAKLTILRRIIAIEYRNKEDATIGKTMLERISEIEKILSEM
jgi:hypothetical protein